VGSEEMKKWAEIGMEGMGKKQMIQGYRNNANGE
jgi:hypothetical protein